MSAYYNEIDPKAAATLRELIKKGLIAPGDVDERSIEDVSPIELTGYTQRHFFAGFGVWSYALRGAGWPDDREVVTMSCPCQPFSAAGKGTGFDDERHLWPAGSWHIRLGRPCPVFGEQVASSDGLAWLDTVSADLETSSYSIAAIDLCAAGVGAPHIRQRLYWMAYPELSQRREKAERRINVIDRADDGGKEEASGSRLDSALGVMAYPASERFSGGRVRVGGLAECTERGETIRGIGGRKASQFGVAGELEHSSGDGRIERRTEPGGGSIAARCLAGELGNTNCAIESEGWKQRSGELVRPGEDEGAGTTLWNGPGPTNGHWRDADWLLCRDGRWRPVEPCTSPLAHGAAQRVGRLRGYGNAIVAPVAQAFIEAVMALDSSVCT